MRTIFAIFYDGLIILSLLILLSFPIVIINHGQAVPPGDKRYLSFILIVILSYFWFMVKLGAQTIGMKAWKMHYEFTRTKHLWLSLLIRFFLFLPVSIMCLFRANKRETLLKKYSGIVKHTQ